MKKWADRYLALLLLGCLCVAVLNGVARESLTGSAKKGGRGSSPRPGDDFYRYANGEWLASTTIPEGRQSYDTRAMLAESTRKRVRDLIGGAATARAATGSVVQKVGDYYASFLDEAGIEAKGMAPLTGEMARIAAIADKASLSAYLGATLNREVDGLTANRDHVFGVWINQGFTDAEHNLPHLWQGGIGLPGRDDYLDKSAKGADLRSKYKAHVAALLRLAGFAEAEIRATRVVSLESKIATSFAPDADAADVSKQNNPWKRGEFDTKAPGMEWAAYFQAAGLAGQRDFIVWQPSAVTGVAALVQREGIDAWQDYLRFHLIEHYASVLPKAVREEHFSFYGMTLAGLRSAPDRSEAAIDATNGALGEGVGQLYTQRYFPPKAKAKAEAMARDLTAAYRARISSLRWMSPQTKHRALQKLDALIIAVGYPERWTDYSKLEILRGDAFGNMRRAEAFYHARDLAKLQEPVEPIEWPMNVQVPGAVIMFSPNAEFFTAGILQLPYFDSEGDTASNYGSAGAGMAHEISHSFDELGNIYDARGRLENWWTDDDKARFQREAAKLGAQLASYCPLSDACLNGTRVLSESVADLAGLVVAHDAYVLSLKGKPDVVRNGLTGEQRFFLAYARRWRRVQTEAALRQQIASDTHAPGEYRSNLVRNVDAWYKAFQVIPRDKLHVKPEDRVQIW